MVQTRRPPHHLDATAGDPAAASKSDMTSSR
jgi:hypothetical protein